MYPTILSPQDVAAITILGSIRSAIGELPSELELSGLNTSGQRAVASGGFTDFWQGTLASRPGRLVAVKSFRLCSLSKIERIKEVSKRSTL